MENYWEITYLRYHGWNIIGKNEKHQYYSNNGKQQFETHWYIVGNLLGS